MKTYTLRAVAMSMSLGDGTYDTTSAEYKINSENGCYVELDPLPNELMNIIPNKGSIFVYGRCTSYINKEVRLNGFLEKIDIENEVYPKPEFSLYQTGWKLDVNNSWYELKWDEISESSRLYLLSKNGFEITNFYRGPASHIKTVAGGYAPYLVLEYDEGSPETKNIYPVGYVKRTYTNTFSWDNRFSGLPAEKINQTSAVIEWKNGASGTVNRISVSGSSTSYTMPANTLPESQEILWRVIAQTAEGQTTSDWTTIKTIDSISTAVAVSPSAIYVDGQKEMLFSWDHAIDTGTLQTGYEIQYKTSATDWTTAQQEETSEEFAYLPPGTLPSGSVTWRVRTYNADGVAGAWSNELTIVIIAAPDAPAVSISVSAPRPVIAWQSREQQAYEADVDGVASGTIYGTGKTYQWQDYLGDGTHIVKVRVLNEFGIWSPWGSTSFSVANVPSGTAVTMTAEGGVDASIRWTSIPDASEYWVYRNGERIAKVSRTDYVDRVYLGNAIYFVRAAHTDGYNYTDSNRVTVNLAVDRVMITALDGDWLDIGYSLTSLPSVSVTRSQDVALMQYAGATLPVPEVSPFERRTYDIKCAFADRQQAARFDDLMARLCCVKDLYGNCIVGILYSYTRAQNAFTTSYSATLYEVDRSAYEEG